MVLDCISKNIAKAQSTLVHILKQLPQGWWFIFHQNGDDNGDLSTALGTRNCLIQALLYNAGIYKINNNKFTLNMDTWKCFTGAPSFKEANLHVETIKRIQYVSYGSNLEYPLPKDQPKNQRNRGSTYLPDDIKSDLRYSYDHYEKEMNKRKAKKEEAAKQSKKKVAVAKKKTNNTDNYPLLSRIVGITKEISLKDEEIEQLSKSVLTEIVKLYETEQKPLSFTLPDGKDMILERLDSSPKKRSRDDNVVSPQPNTEDEVSF